MERESQSNQLQRLVDSERTAEIAREQTAINYKNHAEEVAEREPVSEYFGMQRIEDCREYDE